MWNRFSAAAAGSAASSASSSAASKFFKNLVFNAVSPFVMVMGLFYQSGALLTWSGSNIYT